MRKDIENAQGANLEGPDGFFFRLDSGLLEVSGIEPTTLVNGQYLEIGDNVFLAYAVRYETPAMKKVKDTKIVLFTPPDLKISELTSQGTKLHSPFIEGKRRSATRIPINSQRKIVTAGDVRLDMLRRNASHGTKELRLCVASEAPIVVPEPQSFRNLKELTNNLIGELKGGVIFDSGNSLR